MDNVARVVCGAHVLVAVAVVIISTFFHLIDPRTGATLGE
jgi:hypothetical protein